MKNNRLSNSFFKANPLKEFSAAAILDFSIVEVSAKDFTGFSVETVESLLSEERKQKINQEHNRIETMNDPAELVDYMRKITELFNRRLLCDKILEQQEQTMPLLLKRYRTSALDEFIETAVIVLSLGEKRFAQQLFEMYKEIRCPYAQACACLVFGRQRMEETIPFLRGEFERFKQVSPREHFEQHPLRALYILHGRC